MADAGYGSESNYRYLEGQLAHHIGVIPYGTMLKEKSRNWRSDDRKGMNWDYHATEDYYLDAKGIQFNFNGYRKWTNKEELVRDFKEYQAEKYDENKQVIVEALTPKGTTRKTTVNPSWDSFKAKQREVRSVSETGKLYARRKSDVETVFRCMKVCLGFTRYHVRERNKLLKTNRKKRIKNLFIDFLVRFF